MKAHPVPTAQQQIDFLRNIQRLFDEGDFVATYKYALLTSLVQLAIEKGDNSGEAITLTMREIAEKFAELYWPQTAPYVSRQTGTKRGVLTQNHGKQAAVVNHLTVLRDAGAKTLVEARKSELWDRQIGKIAGVIRDMPVRYLQNMGGDTVNFLYEPPASRAPLELKHGVAHNLRRFQGFLQQMIRAGWISHVRGNRGNIRIIGEADDLETFMFHSSRTQLKGVGDFLREHDGARCFYCEGRLRDTVDVDHFIPWSHYPRDSGHNFVLAHRSCNGKKSDTLAAIGHLEHWIERNVGTGEEFRDGMEELGFMVDLPSTQTIARWAYQQGIDNGSRAWASGDNYESMGRRYLAVIS